MLLGNCLLDLLSLEGSALNKPGEYGFNRVWVQSKRGDGSAPNQFAHVLCKVREIEIFSRWFDRDAKNGRVSKVNIEIKMGIDFEHLINQGKGEV